MIRLLPLLLLAACATAQPSKRQSKPPTATAITASQPATTAAESCELLDRGLLKTDPKAEGPIALAAKVATQRGEQVEQLNSKLDAITKAINAGCVK